MKGKSVRHGSVDPVLQLSGLPRHAVEVVADDGIEQTGVAAAHHMVEPGWYFVRSVADFD